MGVVSFVLDRLYEAEKAYDKLTKKPSDRDPLDDVPTPPGPADPFAAKTAAQNEKVEAPIGKADMQAQVFGKESCTWTGRVKLLLKDRNIAFGYVDLDAPENVKLAARLVRETQQLETPYVYLRGDFIGGYNALSEIERLGQLEELTLPPDRRKGAVGGVKIVIPKRGPEGKAPGES